MKKLLAAALLLALAAPSHGASKFRQDFDKHYHNNNFTAIDYLIKSNKAIIPGEVRELIKEAQQAATFEEKMEILDLASAMATMYMHVHNDNAPLAEVESAQKAEQKKEQARVAELEKWTKYEKFPGNFVMKASLAEMEKKGVAPVLFPTWAHRVHYECKACHDSIFQMKRGAAPIRHEKMDAGQQCGVCHNGTVSFSTKERCERCHIAGKPGEEKLMDARKFDLKAVKEASARVGSTFKPEALPKGEIPIDRFGGIDWAAMKKAGAYDPVKTASNEKNETRENVVLFESPTPFVKAVPFDHKSHSAEIRCANCHPEPFKDALGGNTVTMKEMNEGRLCAACHNSVAFKMTDCNRCHAKPLGEPVKGELTRKK